ncbi:MAG TPA: helix-turn-helix domain-containing protein, partial [Candidatus Paceibacterota bacterium]|nr:helix-turn-helix domain-containing protein [Candidatus Paceibacterota bacterium]
MPTAAKPNKAAVKEEKPPALSSIGAMIARLREDRRMTQAELGEKVGTTQSVIARIEKGEQNLSTETLSKLSEALKGEIIQISKGGTVNFRVHGGHKLSGAIKVRTSKNGAVGVMCASLLNQGTTIIRNTPKIEEVYRIVEVFESIGVRVEWSGNDLRITPPSTFKMKDIHYDSAAKTR